MIVPPGRIVHLWFHGTRLHRRRCSPSSGREVFVNATGKAGQESGRALASDPELNMPSGASEALTQAFRACARAQEEVQRAYTELQERLSSFGGEFAQVAALLAKQEEE